jgi:hypothetical protein
MGNTLLLAISASIVTGIISIAIALLNLRATSKAEKARQLSALTISDLAALTTLTVEINQHILPKLPSAEEVLSPTPEFLERLKLLYESQEKIFKTIANQVLISKHLFSDDQLKEILSKLDVAGSERPTSHVIAHRHDFIITAQKLIDKRIRELRIRLGSD